MERKGVRGHSKIIYVEYFLNLYYIVTGFVSVFNIYNVVFT